MHSLSAKLYQELSNSLSSSSSAKSVDPKLALFSQIVKSQFSNMQQTYSSGVDRFQTSVSNTWTALSNAVTRVRENVTALTQYASDTLNQAANVLNFSEHAQATNDPEVLQHAQNALDEQIAQVENLLGETIECHRDAQKANSQVERQAGQPSNEIKRNQHQLQHNAKELKQTLERLHSQREAVSQKLETLVQREAPEAHQQANAQETAIRDAAADFQKAGTEEKSSLSYRASGQAFTEKGGSQTPLSQNQETYRNCQTLVAKEQYSQLAKEAQKLPESSKTSLCTQLLQAPVKEAALAAAKELVSTLSGQGQIYCKCLIALAEGKPQDVLMLAKSLSDSGKAALAGQLIAQGNLATAEKLVQTMTQGSDKNYTLCTLFMAQGKDALVILQAQQTKLPDSYMAALCEKFMAAGKTGEAMLLAGMVKNPAVLQDLCKAFLAAGASQEVVELAKDLPPEMQLAVAKMLLEAGCLKEAMELGMHMPMEQQMELFQALLQKNPALALQFAAKILQNPEQAKQLIQMLLDKGLVADAKLLLKLANNPQLDKEFAHLLAQEKAKKDINNASIGCESEDASTDGEEQDEEASSNEEDQDEEEEEEE
ncbi:MAG: hypothetical protein K2Y01_06000 [Rhabdochlamydiaceae bacterium]|nr:hypothetical protein [Rhabdochlamydiaceae bacterium]